jgi:hypothetical protein
VVISNKGNGHPFFIEKISKMLYKYNKSTQGGCSMNREQEIRNQIWEYEQMYEKRKGKLALKTWAVLSVAFYVLAFCFGWMHDPLDFLGGIVLSAVASGVFMFVSVLVMAPLNNLRGNEIAILTRLRTELDLLEKGL